MRARHTNPLYQLSYDAADESGRPVNAMMPRMRPLAGWAAAAGLLACFGWKSWATSFRSEIFPCLGTGATEDVW
jgi:hypothetical protein